MVIQGGGPVPGGTQLSVKNNCPSTIWLAMTPNPNYPSLGNNIQVTSGQSYTYNIPNGNWAGRFWPKIGCDGFGVNCLFGDSSITGQPPADTKIEFNFQGSSKPSFYDISLVDGYSLPIQIVPRGVNQGSCVPTVCTVSLGAGPQNEIGGLGDLRVIRNGQVVACLSPCKRW